MIRLSITRQLTQHRRTLSLGSRLQFHQDDLSRPKSKLASATSFSSNQTDREFDSYYRDVQNRFANVDNNSKYSIAKEAFLSGYLSGQASHKESAMWSAGIQLVVKVIGLIGTGLILYWLVNTMALSVGSVTGRDVEEHEYMVEDSKKNFSDVKGMPEILAEFQQVVDIIKNKDKYTNMGAELPRGVLLRNRVAYFLFCLEKTI